MSTTTISLEHTFEQSDFDAFAELSGDSNPIHVDAAYSSRTRFGRTVAHGILLSAVFRGLLERLAPGTRLSGQALKFSAPTFAGDAMRFDAALADPGGGHRRALFRCTRIADGIVTCEGMAELTGGDV